MKINLLLTIVLLFIVYYTLAHGSGGRGSGSGRRGRYEYRSINGTGNNKNHKTWGETGSLFKLMFSLWNITRTQLPNERTLSNTFLAETFFDKIDKDFTFEDRQTLRRADPFDRNALFIIFNQFVSHDLGLNEGKFDFQNFLNNAQVKILDPNDPLYETHAPDGTPYNPPRTRLITPPSKFYPNSEGKLVGKNLVTDYLDLSTVYGSTDKVAWRIRSHQDGKLKTSGDGELPLYTRDPELNVPNECGDFGLPSSSGGDIRADENPALYQIQRTFLREHNRLCDELKQRHSDWNDEKLYQEARRRNIAQYQSIVYNEMLPLLIGEEETRELIGEYRGYKSNLQVGVFSEWNFFATRTVHPMVSLPQLQVYPNCTSFSAPGISPGYEHLERGNCIRDFVDEKTAEGFPDTFLRGMIIQAAQDPSNAKCVDTMRSIPLRQTTQLINLDICSMDLFRARSHQVPNYYEMIKNILGVDIYQLPRCEKNPNGKDPLQCFIYITSNLTAAYQLRDIYEHIDRIDPFIGASIDERRTSMGFPVTAAFIYAKQFQLLRDGDRFYFENIPESGFSRAEIRQFKRTKFADIIERNSGLRNLPRDIFFRRNSQTGTVGDVSSILCTNN